jgi:hypothetical protein
MATVHIKAFCALLAATFLCLSSVLPAFANNPFPNNPVFAMKSIPVSGYCYLPNPALNLTLYLRIEEFYNDSKLVGDLDSVVSPAAYQPGNVSFTWQSHWMGKNPAREYPDGRCSLTDVFDVFMAYGSAEGDPRWNYMADVSPDRVINLKDIFRVCVCYGHTGTYVWPYTNQTSWDNGYAISVTFYPSGATINGPDSLGCVNIPHPSSDTYFVVTLTSAPSGSGLVPGPIGAVISFWTVYPQ